MEVRVSVTGVGIVPLSFDRVHYRIAASAQADEGPRAHEVLKPVISNTLKLIAEEAEAHQIDMTRFESKLDIRLFNKWEGSNRVPDGYEARWTANFTSTDVNHSDSFFEKLVAIKGLTAEAPTFTSNRNAETEEAAFLAAFEDADRRFQMQCRIIGVDRKNFKVLGWQVSGDKNYREKAPIYTMGSADPAFFSKVNPGENLKTLTLTLNYGSNLLQS